MCGVTGFWAEQSGVLSPSILARMNDAMENRGPDDRGVWFDPETGVGLAQRRLAIVDLSPAGHQPMTSHCGRFKLVFNGEIYNHTELRKRLEAEGNAPVWRGHSDTETLISAIGAWGFEEALKQLNGMFAIAVWDCERRTMSLARDRMGEKPLYYGWIAGDFVFGSELKAIRRHPRWRGEIDRTSLGLFLRYCAVPAPRSIYSGIYKLQPGHWLQIESPRARHEKVRCYWNLPELARQGEKSPLPAATPEYQGELAQRLHKAVGMRMMADVPLGAFLSGGVDSSVIVAMMQAQSAQPVRTFSIGFEEAEYDEAPYAAEVARHLGTDHTELYVDSAQALATLPALPAYWDEPFADSSQIPTLLVSRLARESVTVSLSGDGGDELFHGYSRYHETVANWQRLKRFPLPLRRALSRIAMATALPLAALLDRLSGGKPQALNRLLLKAAALGPGVRLGSEDALYDYMMTYLKADLALGASLAPPGIARESTLALEEFPNRMMLSDMETYLPDTILTKVDRASMAASLEARAPLLDHTLVEFAWRLPLTQKNKPDMGKWILRQVLYEHVPRELIERPKQGFGIPLDSWLRGPLIEWAEDLLNPDKLYQQGYLDVNPVLRMWRAHKQGRYDYHYQLWPILTFQAWLQQTTSTSE